MDINLSISVPPSHKLKTLLTIQSPSPKTNETYFDAFLNTWHEHTHDGYDASALFQQYEDFVISFVNLIKQTKLPQTLETLMTLINKTGILQVYDVPKNDTRPQKQPYCMRVSFESGMDYGYFDTVVHATSRVDAIQKMMKNINNKTNIIEKESRQPIKFVTYKTRDSLEVNTYDVPIHEALSRDLLRVAVLKKPK